MSATIIAEMRGDELCVDFGDKGVTIRGPFDYETVRLACKMLHEMLAGVAEFQLVVAAMNALEASGMPLRENNEDCSRPKAGSPTAEGGCPMTPSLPLEDMMKPLPPSPMERHARAHASLLAGIRDGNTYGRLNALREVSKLNRRAGDANNAPVDNQ